MEARLSVRCLIDLATRAQRDWRQKSEDLRLLTLESYALTEVLSIGTDAGTADLPDLPQCVALRVIVDFGCREEAARRGHDPEATFERAVAQAVELQDFRRDLDTAVRAIPAWTDFMDQVCRTSA